MKCGVPDAHVPTLHSVNDGICQLSSLKNLNFLVCFMGNGLDRNSTNCAEAAVLA